MSDAVATPGSDAAIRQGCTCPVLDNHHGEGFPMDGEVCFWHTQGCPVHDAPSIDREHDEDE